MRCFKLQTGELVLVDDADLSSVEKLKWHIGSDGYAKHSYRSNGKVNSLYLHTFLTGAVKTDHKNGNKLDNQRSNLRPASNSQNASNRRKTNCATTSKFKGVTWRKDIEKWQAQIRNGRYIYLGVFTSDTDAAQAYDNAAIKLFGSFAKLNNGQRI